MLDPRQIWASRGSWGLTATPALVILTPGKSQIFIQSASEPNQMHLRFGSIFFLFKLFLSRESHE